MITEHKRVRVVRLLATSRPFLGIRAPKVGDIGFVVDVLQGGKALTVEISRPGELECLCEFGPEELVELDDPANIG